jgi:hypothetical protein
MSQFMEYPRSSGPRMLHVSYLTSLRPSLLLSCIAIQLQTDP